MKEYSVARSLRRAAPMHKFAVGTSGARPSLRGFASVQQRRRVMADKRKLMSIDEQNAPVAVKKYAEAMGLSVSHPRVLKYAEGMKGRKADDEIIEGPFKAKSVWKTPEEDLEELATTE